MLFTSTSSIIARVSSQWRGGGVCWSPCRSCARMWTSRRLSQSECRRRSSCSALLIQLDITPTALVLREELQMNSSLATTLVIGKKIFVKVGHKDRVKIILFRCTTKNVGSRCIWYKIKRTLYTYEDLNMHTVNGQSPPYQLEHVRSGDWSCIRCCKARPDGPMCRCSDIYNAESFTRCQDSVYNS